MAINYDGTDDYHAHGLTQGVGAATYTMACWVRRNANFLQLTPVFIGNRSNAARNKDIFEGITFGFDDLGGGPPSSGSHVHAVTWLSSASYGVAAGATATTVDTWYHVAAVFRGDVTERKIYLNGVEDGASNIGRNFIGTRISYAVLERTTNTRFANLEIAEPAIWNGVELDDAEIVSLAAGARPDEVRPANLVVWNRFITVPPQGMLNKPTSWTTGGAPAGSAHPPVSEPVEVVARSHRRIIRVDGLAVV